MYLNKMYDVNIERKLKTKGPRADINKFYFYIAETNLRTV